MLKNVLYKAVVIIIYVLALSCNTTFAIPASPNAFETHQLADHIWSLLEQHLTYRVVLEMDDIKVLRSELIAQLILLCRKIDHHGGVIRLSGISANNTKVLQACSLLDRLPAYRDRCEAVMGCQRGHAEETVKPR